jgi:hypothetical protein
MNRKLPASAGAILGLVAAAGVLAQTLPDLATRATPSWAD